MKFEGTTTHKGRYVLAILVLSIIVGIPLAVWSFPGNPPVGKTGAPGESTCASCHGGGLGGGKIAVTASSGTTYHPGTKQPLTVTITDAHASDWGYEMTAVQTTKTTTGAGTFKATDNLSAVRTSGTKSYAAQVNDQVGKTKAATYKIDWTPPAKNVGKVTLYLSGIGGTGDPAADSVYKRLGRATGRLRSKVVAERPRSSLLRMLIRACSLEGRPDLSHEHSYASSYPDCCFDGHTD
jgi:hypothetical protein